MSSRGPLSEAGELEGVRQTRARARTRHGLAALNAAVLSAYTLVCLVLYFPIRVAVASRDGKRAVAARWTRRWFAGIARVLGWKLRVVWGESRKTYNPKNMVPSLYVVDAEGKIAASGHPDDMNVAAIVNGLLEDSP